MNRIACCVIALALTTGAAHAELAKMECAAVSSSLRQTLSLIESVKSNLIKVGRPMPDIVRTAGATTAGDAAYDFEAKRAALVENMRSFLESGDRFDTELRKCGQS